MEGHPFSRWPFFTPLILVKHHGLAATFLALCTFTSGTFSAEPSTAVDTGCINQLRIDSGRIDRITDGDTLVLDDLRRVRLIGINTPELDEPEPSLRRAAHNAKQALEDLLPHGEPVLLYVGNDAYDRHKRLLAHVIRQADRQAVAEALLKQGQALHIAVAPNTLCASYFAALETNARKDQLGIWKHNDLLITAAASINKKSRGFKLIKGTVTRIERHSKNTRLTLDKKLPVLVSNKLVDQLKDVYLPANLMDRKVEVRGWLSHRKKQTQLQLQHNSNLRLAPD